MLTFKLFVMTVSLNCFGNTSFNYNDDEDRLFNVSTSVFGLLKVCCQFKQCESNELC